MPYWDYVCNTCKERTTLHFSNWADATRGEIACPYCSQGQLVRQPSAPSFTVKGFNADNGYSSK